jgi:hypothetical protein
MRTESGQGGGDTDFLLQEKWSCMEEELRVPGADKGGQEHLADADGGMQDGTRRS